MSYEAWTIGYPNPDFDADGLISGINLNFTFGIYALFDDDGNLYTFDAGFGESRVEPDEVDETRTITGFGEDLALTLEDVFEALEEGEMDVTLDTNVLFDDSLAGITPLKIALIDDAGDTEGYFIVDWSYGDTSRPSFTYDTSLSTESDSPVDVMIYDVTYNGDKGALKDTFQHTSAAFTSAYENIIVDVIATTDEPYFNFKKLKRKKINCIELGMFEQSESGTIADTTMTTTTTTSGADTTTTTTTTTSGY